MKWLRYAGLKPLLLIRFIFEGLVWTLLAALLVLGFILILPLAVIGGGLE